MVLIAQLERDDLEREREAAMMASEEHEYRAQELAANVERLAEEAAEKDHALETVRHRSVLR